MAFVGPDSLVNDTPPPSRRFIGPDSAMVETTNNPPPEENPVIGALKQVAKPFISADKLIAQPVETMAKDIVTPDNPQARSGYGPNQSLEYERSSAYPASTYTDPTVMDVQNAVAIGEGAGALAKASKVGLSALAKNEAPKIASNAFVGPDAIQQSLPLTVANPDLLTPAVKIDNTVIPITEGGHKAAGVVAGLQRQAMAGATDEESISKAVNDVTAKFRDPANKGYVDPQGKFLGLEEAQQKINQMKTNPFAKNVPLPEPQPPVPSNPPISFTPQDVNEMNQAGANLPVPGAPKVALDNKDLQQINAATGTNLPLKYEQAPLPRTKVPPTPAAPTITDPLVKSFGDEMAMGHVTDRFVPGVSDMNRQFSLVATNPETAATGSLQQVKNSVTQAEIRVGQQYNNYLRELDQFGVAPGSKESTALFHYVEGNVSKEQLVEEFGAKTAGKIEKEAAYMRKNYDLRLDRINDIRESRGLKPITKRENYVNHMDEISAVGTDILNKIKGDSDLVDAAQKAMAQKDVYRVAEPDVAFRHIIRKGGKTAEDAVTSFRKYMYDSLQYEYLQPEVERINQMSDLARASKMPNLAARLEDYAGYIAGKPEVLDKLAADTVGKTTLALIHKLSKNVTYSVISFNPSVWAAQMLRLFPKIMNEGLFNGSFKAGLKLFSSEARMEAFDNIPFLQKMFLNREEAAITGGFGGPGLGQKFERLGANVPAYIDQSFAMHTALLSHDAKLADLTMKYPLTDKAVLEKQAWAYAEHNVENYQALISKSATPPYFRSKTSKILTPLMREATLMTDFLYHDVLRNSGDVSRATQVARAFAGLTAMSAMGSVMEFLGGEDQKPLLGKALFPMLKALESSGSMVKTAAAPLTATKAYMEGKGTFGNLVTSTLRTAVLARGTPGGLQLTEALDKLFKD